MFNTIGRLIALSNSLQIAQTVEEAYAALAAQAMAISGAGHASLALVTADGHALTLVYGAGSPLPWPAARVPVANSRLGDVARTGTAFVRPGGDETPSSLYVD